MRALDFDATSRYLGIGGDEILHIWDLKRRKRVRALAGHTGIINTLAFSPDASQIASGSGSGSTLVHNVRNRDVAARLAHPPNASPGVSVAHLAYSGRGVGVGSGGSGGGGGGGGGGGVCKFVVG